MLHIFPKHLQGVLRSDRWSSIVAVKAKIAISSVGYQGLGTVSILQYDHRATTY